MMKLSDFAYDVYSQFGEDGIIERIFQLIGVEAGICIEVGAWDGIYLSNTANLWRNGWLGILIESDFSRFKDLRKNTKGFSCHCIKAQIGFTTTDSLEAFLTREDLPMEVDFLSLDIDGDEYHVFERLTHLQPRVICIEYNPTIPAHIELLPEPGNYFGCSALSLVKLAHAKDYELIAMTETNCFFVRSAESNKFKDFDSSYENLVTDKHITYIMSGYDGNYVLSRKPTYGFQHPSPNNFIGSYYLPRINSEISRRIIATITNQAKTFRRKLLR